MKSVLVLFLSLTLIACETLTGSDDRLPEWWTSPIEDSTEWLYGLGEGETLNAANQQALVNVAGKLQTKISGSLSRRTQETTVSADDYIDRKMSSEIERVSLSHFETLKIETLFHRVLTLVRVDRQALADDWLRQYQSIEADIQALLSDKQKSRFQWWMTARYLKPNALEGDRLAALISSLTSTEKVSSLTHRLEQAMNENKPTVTIKGDQSNLNQVITSELLAQGLRVSGCRRCDLIIQYNTNFSSNVLFGESVVKMDFSGTLTDGSGDFSSNHWSTSASSVSGLGVGKKATLSIAVQKIKGEGLWKVFGMETK